MKRKATQSAPEKPAVEQSKEFVTIWWRGKLDQGRLQFQPNAPSIGTVYVNGNQTNEKVHEVLNRLQGEIVCHSQAVYGNSKECEGIHTQSWTVCIHKNKE
jgi:hypothetical protein